MKRWTSLLLALLLVCSMAGAQAEAVTDEGKCGKTLTWRLLGDTLIISGDGYMEDFLFGEHSTNRANDGMRPPWENHKQNITAVIMEEGVKNVEQRAFTRCPKLKKVFIPKSMEGIYEFSFTDSPMIEALYYAGSEDDWENVDIIMGHDFDVDVASMKVIYNATVDMMTK